MEFIKENLVLVLTLASFVVFAIIGYIVDHSKNKDNKEKDILKEDITEEIKPNIDVTKDSKETTNKKDKNIENEMRIKHVSMDEIVQIMNENTDYIILDVRTIAEYNEGHIPNAICIPNETIGSNTISELPDKEQLILVYCRSGNRSKQAAEKLKKLGYTNLIEFGGIIDWKGEIER